MKKLTALLLIVCLSVMGIGCSQESAPTPAPATNGDAGSGTTPEAGSGTMDPAGTETDEAGDKPAAEEGDKPAEDKPAEDNN